MTREATDIVRLHNAAMDTTAEGIVVIRGVLEPESLNYLLADTYQREAQPASSLKALIEDMKLGKMPPDIELGTRGENFHEVSPHEVDLYDPTYIVDGLQRVTAGRYLMGKGIDLSLLHLGASVYIGTNFDWERDRFRKLNTLRNRVSSSVLLHNMIPDYKVVELLHRMTTGEYTDFVMRDRVQWGQNQKEHELLSAHSLFKILSHLMNHMGAVKTNKIESLAQGLQKVYEDIGPNVFRDNVRLFFETVDRAWSIRTIMKKDTVPFVKLTFLQQLANLFSQHYNFWDARNSNRLFVNVDDLRKLHGFPVYDNTVAQLAASGGKAHNMLFQMMVDHMNSGRRTGFLRPRIRQFNTGVPDGEYRSDDSEADDETVGLDMELVAAATPQANQ